MVQRSPRKFDAVRVPGHVTIEEAVGISGLPENTIMEWIDEGLLLATKPVNKKQLWIMESNLQETIERWKESSRQPNDSLTPNEAGRMLGVTGEAVKTWIYKRWLRATKQSNGYWRIKHEDLKSYLESREKLSSKVYMATENRDLAGSIAAAAQSLGAEAHLVPDFVDALRRFAESPPNLIIVDLSNFPEAWKLIRKVRGTSYYGSPKILLLVKEPLDEKETGDALRLGINGCLVGEVTDAVLEAEVKGLLGKSM